jgi:hypothetical protein
MSLRPLKRGPGHRAPPESAGFGTGPGPEVVVVDAGSQDGSAERASQTGARVLTAERGRGRRFGIDRMRIVRWVGR